MSIAFPDLANRLRKRFAHFQKMGKRLKTTSFRVYAKDLPDYPLFIEWIDGDVVAWLFDRTRDDTPEKQQQFILGVEEAILDAFQIQKPKLFLKSRRIQKGLEAQYEKTRAGRIIKTITEAGLHFEVNLSDYLDIGLFLDHRLTRNHIRGISSGKKVLNLFAYTGSFSCYSLSGGAYSVTTVDLNPNYSEWTRRNMSLNGFLEGESNRIISQDCFQFLTSERNTSNRYDLIICDPPTFSNSKRAGADTFSVDEDYSRLITACAALLTTQGLLFFSTNSRSFKLDPATLPSRLSVEEISTQTVPEDFKGQFSHRCWVISA